MGEPWEYRPPLTAILVTDLSLEELGYPVDWILRR
jgi:hypothetical protein